MLTLRQMYQIDKLLNYTIAKYNDTCQIYMSDPVEYYFLRSKLFKYETVIKKLILELDKEKN